MLALWRPGLCQHKGQEILVSRERNPPEASTFAVHVSTVYNGINHYRYSGDRGVIFARMNGRFPVFDKLLLRSSGVTLLTLLVEKTSYLTFNPLPIFLCNDSVTVPSCCYFKCNEIDSVTVPSYCYFKCNEIVTSYNKK